MKHFRNFRMAMAAALMCLPILFASCNKEEENNNNNNSEPEPAPTTTTPASMTSSTA